MKLLRRSYNWVLSWAEKPFSGLALLLLSFVESSVFPIPPDPLLIALILGNKKRSFYFATLCTVGSVLGGLFGYFIGFYLWDLSKNIFFDVIPGFSPALFDQMKVHYDKWSFWVVFTSGFTPIPYKIFTISSGVFEIPLLGFVCASTVGRASRFFLLAVLIRKFGEPIKTFIDRYFNLLTILFLLLLVGGVFVSKMILV